MWTVDDLQYNDIPPYNDGGLFDINRKLMWCIQNHTTTNRQPIYVSISDGTTTIENLEMCEISERKYIIDLAPFIQSMFGDYSIYRLDNNRYAILKQITLTANSYGEETNPTIVRKIYCTTSRRNTVYVVEEGSWHVPYPGKPTGVYYSDIKANDLSPMYLPDVDSCRIYQSVFSFDTTDAEEYFLQMSIRNSVVQSSATSVNVNKRMADGSSVVVGEREIIRQPYCDKKNICLLYLSHYGQYEFFTFEGYSKEISATKNNDIARVFGTSDYCASDGTMTAGDSITEEITVYATITDDVMAEKFKDIITTTQAFIYDPSRGNLTNVNSFVPVKVDGALTTIPKRGTKNSVKITKTNKYLW